jgi:dTDP-4-dehydrorhamnose 3,5-epimerase
MLFAATAIDGVTVVDIEPVRDERGFFARLHCPDAFAAAGHTFVPAQTSLSRNIAAFTLRGLHYEASPHEEAKLVRVARGRIFDVAVDLRPESPTYRKWTGVELSADSGRALLIGRGMAHGFLTLEPDTDVLYQIDRIFEPGYGRGVRWNDPAFGIEWPAAPQVMSERDAGYADYGASA